MCLSNSVLDEVSLFSFQPENIANGTSNERTTVKVESLAREGAALESLSVSNGLEPNGLVGGVRLESGEAPRGVKGRDIMVLGSCRATQAPFRQDCCW